MRKIRKYCGISWFLFFNLRSSKAIKNDENIIRSHRVLITHISLPHQLSASVLKAPDITSSCKGGLCGWNRFSLALIQVFILRITFRNIFQSWLIDIKIIHNFYTSNLNYFYIIVGWRLLRRNSVPDGPCGDIILHVNNEMKRIFLFDAESRDGRMNFGADWEMQNRPVTQSNKILIKNRSTLRKKSWDG